MRRRSTGVGLVLVLSTMLHGIGVGNMLPAWVRVVCVDINPAVVTKLADRGSSQTIGIVTDVGLFLHQLAKSAPKVSATATCHKPSQGGGSKDRPFATALGPSLTASSMELSPGQAPRFASSPSLM